MKGGIVLLPLMATACDATLPTHAERQVLIEGNRDVYRGTWFVAFETFWFTPIGQKNCAETLAAKNCFELSGEVLPWPGRWDCAREYAVEFVGHREASAALGHLDKIVVDNLVAAKRLPDPYDENCDPKLNPEVKAKR